MLNEKEDDEVGKSQADTKTFNIFCVKCNEYLCDSNSVRKRVSNFITIDESFIQNKIICSQIEVKVFKTEKHIGKILCKNPTCGNILGSKLEYTMGSIVHGHTLTIKNIKFKSKLENDDGNYILYSKWKDVAFQVEEISI